MFYSIVFYICGTPSSEEIKRSRVFPYRPRRAELYRRYIDDIVGGASCRREELEAFVNFVANFNPALQFTSTIFEIKLPFLDISLRISDIRIQTSVHYKATDTHNYLHFSSFHPQHCKCSIPYSQFLRLRRLCPGDDGFLLWSKEMVSFAQFFTDRGYPLSYLENDLQRVAIISPHDALRPSEQGDTTVDRVPLVFTHHPFNTFAFYQRMSKPSVSFHNHLLQRTSATSV